MMSNHLYDGLMNAVQLDRLFAEIPSKNRPPTRYYTYGHVEEVSGRLANLLVHWGVEVGERVAVQVPKSIEAIMLYLACVRMGAIFLPLNTAYTPNEVDYFLSDSEVKIFICAPNDQDKLTGVAVKNSTRLETLGVYSNPDDFAGSVLAQADSQPTKFNNVTRNATDLAAILYTSGTTGRSKGAMLTHENLLSNSITLAKIWRFTKDDVLLHALPIYHTHGLFVAINVTLLSGASMIFLSEFNTDLLIKNLPRSSAMMGVPTFYTRLLDDQRFNADLVSKMRLFISGSAPLLAETHVQFEQRTGHRVLERYGMTETNMNTSNPYDGERRAGTVGQPLPDVELRICDPETGHKVVAGEIGVLEIKGPNV
ncbi:MAG: AMP-binding protein, partial [Rhizobiaceae bacterium]